MLTLSLCAYSPKNMMAEMKAELRLNMSFLRHKIEFFQRPHPDVYSEEQEASHYLTTAETRG